MAPMTNAERQKKYRERLKQNPIKYEELRVRHLERVNQSRKRGIKKKQYNAIFGIDLQRIYTHRETGPKKSYEKFDNIKTQNEHKIKKAVGIKGKIRSRLTRLAKRKLFILEIHKFFLRDDISRPTAGKKECKTKNKTKMQIRLLTDTMNNLYKIYKRDGGKVSYAT
ncbi:uncharacterized protein LOC133534308 [Cydia pomonella]|uniref:uncharacterized protein LOC133534308 n=1 Tax=Cydia pomonella TaxID=82600 RepID=UPI002ADE4EA5|nr:uncharacterized protein LOC133534308 [Cydia pomonella]